MKAKLFVVYLLGCALLMGCGKPPADLKDTSAPLSVTILKAHFELVGRSCPNIICDLALDNHTSFNFTILAPNGSFVVDNFGLVVMNEEGKILQQSINLWKISGGRERYLDANGSITNTEDNSVVLHPGRTEVTIPFIPPPQLPRRLKIQVIGQLPNVSSNTLRSNVIEIRVKMDYPPSHTASQSVPSQDKLSVFYDAHWQVLGRLFDALLWLPLFLIAIALICAAFPWSRPIAWAVFLIPLCAVLLSASALLPAFFGTTEIFGWNIMACGFGFMLGAWWGGYWAWLKSSHLGTRFPVFIIVLASLLFLYYMPLALFEFYLGEYLPSCFMLAFQKIWFPVIIQVMMQRESPYFDYCLSALTLIMMTCTGLDFYRLRLRKHLSKVSPAAGS